jgi:putative SOS response-associated peptidase YedK
MCGRLFQTTPAPAIADLFGAADHTRDFQPRYNGAPTQAIAVMRSAGYPRSRRLDTLRWGLIPSWARDATIAAHCINARAETIATKPSFKAAFKSRRCILPIDGFYEWTAANRGREKLPYAIAAASGAMLACAGLWETWRDGTIPVETFAIITTNANATVAPIHPRMPAILPPEAIPVWLGETAASERELEQLLHPCADVLLKAWRVGRDVGNVANDRPDLIEPLAAALTA